ncbi:hypothetical protein EZV62_018516 [Acer yangbiense]|uniref:Uncharacterized protein n=1 Tax=Acer yangbiense TaxID=1000413 RepID=A0A5C7HJI0_9ROSI|nr:hypothetical protein EZV62_018516 [Acer yangbiense]
MLCAVYVFLQVFEWSKSNIQMAMAVVVSQSCGMWFIRKSFQSAIIFEARRGYRSALGRKMRFSNFLPSRVSKLCSRSKFDSTGKMFGEELLVPAWSKSRKTVKYVYIHGSGVNCWICIISFKLHDP